MQGPQLVCVTLYNTGLMSRVLCYAYEQGRGSATSSLQAGTPAFFVLEAFALHVLPDCIQGLVHELTRQRAVQHVPASAQCRRTVSL